MEDNFRIPISYAKAISDDMKAEVIMKKYYREYNHIKTIENVTMDILFDVAYEKLNIYKANSLIHLQIKYCKERDEKLRKEKLEIDINAGNEINK